MNKKLLILVRAPISRFMAAVTERQANALPPNLRRAALIHTKPHFTPLLIIHESLDFFLGSFREASTPDYLFDASFVLSVESSIF